MTIFATGISLAACGASQDTPVFGGEGASVDAKQTPLSEAPPEVATGPCANAAAPSETKLLDDFEDGDNQLFKATDREGWWYVAADSSDGKIFPAVGGMKPVELPADEVTVQNRWALYGKALDYKDWGVVWGTTLRWVNRGVKCPLNLSKFIGFRLRARGSGTLDVKLNIPETVPVEMEGRCKEKCWDAHSQRFKLSPQWQPYVVRWDRVQQGGWGTQAQFDPSRLLSLNFSAGARDLPLEVWIDDIELIATEAELPTALNAVDPAAVLPPPPAAANAIFTAVPAATAPTATAPTAAAPTATPPTATVQLVPATSPPVKKAQ